METFILAGSKGGAGRSTSSILLATGLSALGFRPLYVQVLAAGRPSILDGVADVPFENDQVTWNEAESLELDFQAPISRHPACFPIVVDMPSQRLRGGLVAAPDVRILLPMRTGVLEIEWVAHDYRNAEEEFNQHSGDAERPPVWFLPVGWPSNHQSEDHAAILGRHGVAVAHGMPFPVILPGIPKLDWFDLNLFVGARFDPTFQREAAVAVAKAVLARTGSLTAPP